MVLNIIKHRVVFAFVAVEVLMVLGKVLVEGPTDLSLRIKDNTLVLECKFRTTVQSERVTQVNWLRKRPGENRFNNIVQIPIPSGKPFYRDSNLGRRSNITLIPDDNINGKTNVKLSVQPECSDQAMYQCQVNVFGGTPPQALVVNVKILEDPMILSLRKPGAFLCSAVVGNPAGSLKWIMVRRIRDNLFENVTMGGLTTQRTDPNYCSVVVDSKLTTDVGPRDDKIMCRVTSVTRSVARELPILVPYAVKNIKILVTVEGREYAHWITDVTAQEGETVVFNCTARGRPNPVYRWRYMAAEDRDWTWLNSSDQSSLVLTNVSEIDAGKYECFAENTFNANKHTTFTEIRLIVKTRIEEMENIPETTDSGISRHAVVLIILFVAIVLFALTLGVCIMICCGVRRRRGRRRTEKPQNTAVEYHAVVRSQPRRTSNGPSPPRAGDDFRI